VSRNSSSQKAREDQCALHCDMCFYAS
jgi:hypothetical protein